MRGRNDDHGAVVITRKEVRREQCLVVLGYIFSHTCVWFRPLGSKLELIASAINNGPVAVMLRAILFEVTGKLRQAQAGMFRMTYKVKVKK